MDGLLFKVHKHFFTSGSAILAVKFSTKDLGSDDAPVVFDLEDEIKAVEFESLLWLFYDSYVPFPSSR